MPPGPGGAAPGDHARLADAVSAPSHAPPLPSVFGHRVFICFCLGPSAGLGHVGLEPSILDRLPRVDRPDVPFIPSLAMFAMPEGVRAARPAGSAWPSG